MSPFLKVDLQLQEAALKMTALKRNLNRDHISLN